MDGWVDGWMGGWMDRWINIQTDGSLDEWMTCNFFMEAFLKFNDYDVELMSHSTVFQSYMYSCRMIMKGCVQWNRVAFVKRILPPARFEPRLLA